MKAKELRDKLEFVDDDSEVIIVVYTDNSYESGYVDRVDPFAKYNCITGERLDDDDSVVEITTTTKVKR